MIAKVEIYSNLQKFQTCPDQTSFICARCGMVLSVIPLCLKPFVLLQCSECISNQLFISIYDFKLIEMISPLDPREYDCGHMDNGICKALGKTKTRCVYMDKREGL